jgi:hypothetical protein
MVLPRNIVLPNWTTFTRTLTTRPFDCMDIDSPVQTGIRMGRLCHPSVELRVALTTNTDTPIPDFNTRVIDCD